MPELIANLPAVAILLPAASVYVLWALFHWIFTSENESSKDDGSTRQANPKPDLTSPQAPHHSNRLPHHKRATPTNSSGQPGSVLERSTNTASRTGYSAAPQDLADGTDVTSADSAAFAHSIVPTSGHDTRPDADTKDRAQPHISGKLTTKVKTSTGADAITPDTEISTNFFPNPEASILDSNRVDQSATHEPEFTTPQFSSHNPQPSRALPRPGVIRKQTTTAAGTSARTHKPAPEADRTTTPQQQTPTPDSRPDVADGITSSKTSADSKSTFSNFDNKRDSGQTRHPTDSKPLVFNTQVSAKTTVSKPSNSVTAGAAETTAEAEPANQAARPDTTTLSATPSSLATDSNARTAAKPGPVPISQAPQEARTSRARTEANPDRKIIESGVGDTTLDDRQETAIDNTSVCQSATTADATKSTWRDPHEKHRAAATSPHDQATTKNHPTKQQDNQQTKNPQPLSGATRHFPQRPGAGASSQSKQANIEHQGNDTSAVTTTTASNTIDSLQERLNHTSTNPTSTPGHVNPGQAENRQFNLIRGKSTAPTGKEASPKTPYKTAAKLKTAAPDTEVKLQLKTPDIAFPGRHDGNKESIADPDIDASGRSDHAARVHAQLLRVKDEKINALQATLQGLESALKQRPQSSQHQNNNIVAIENATSRQNRDGSYKEKYENAVARLINNERKLAKLQSTINNLQAYGLPETSVATTQSTHARPTLLSKVRVMTNG